MNRTATPLRTVANGRRSSGTIKAEVMRDVRALLTEVEADAHKAEDRRANKRNRNRMYMLAFTVFSMFGMVTFLKAFAPALIPYAAPLALVPDFGLTLWALARKL